MIHHRGAPRQQGFHRRPQRAEIDFFRIRRRILVQLCQPQLQRIGRYDPSLPHFGRMGVGIDKARQQELVTGIQFQAVCARCG